MIANGIKLETGRGAKEISFFIISKSWGAQPHPNISKVNKRIVPLIIRFYITVLTLLKFIALRKTYMIILV